VLSSAIELKEGLIVIGADGLLGGALRAHWRRAGRNVAAAVLRTEEGSENVEPLDLAQPVASSPPD
jgi:hypothetical protein